MSFNIAFKLNDNFITFRVQFIRSYRLIQKQNTVYFVKKLISCFSWLRFEFLMLSEFIWIHRKYTLFVYFICSDELTIDCVTLIYAKIYSLYIRKMYLSFISYLNLKVFPLFLHNEKHQQINENLNLKHIFRI